MSNTKKWVVTHPLSALLLGLTPAIAGTTDVRLGLAMGLTMTLTMLLAGLIVSALKAFMTSWLSRLCVGTAVALSLSMVLHALLPEVYGMAGMYFGLLSVSLVTVASTERAMNHSVASTAGHTLCSGVSVTVLLVLTAAVREVFGKASFAGIVIEPLAKFTVPILATTPGALLVLAIVVAIAQKLGKDNARSDEILTDALGEVEE